MLVWRAWLRRARPPGTQTRGPQIEIALPEGPRSGPVASRSRVSFSFSFLFWFWFSALDLNFALALAFALYPVEERQIWDKLSEPTQWSGQKIGRH